MQTPELIDLDRIDPNPYQPREQEDPEHVKKIALSIAQQGLLQVPAGRRLDGRVQLSYGNTRLAAFRWLRDVQPHSNIEGDYAAMPVLVLDLSDLEMFEKAIAENLDRKDLSPIEQAKAMRVYREQFGKTSAEIGQLFGLSESAVRNKMRLLELPEAVQGHITGGEISEGTARKLMVLDKLVPEKVAEVAEQIATNEIRDPEKVSSLIESTIRDKAVHSRTIKQLWNGRWDKGEPRAGSGLWPLTWTPETLLDLKFSEFKKLYSGPETIEILYPEIQPGVPDRPRTYPIKEAFDYLLLVVHHEQAGQRIATVQARIAEAAPEALDLVRQLVRPPACTACPFHSVLDGIHYCGLVPCWKNKRQAWYAQELARVSAEMGIPVYDKDQDPKDYEEATQWGDVEKRFKKFLKEKADHLRLKIDYREYDDHAFTGSRCVQLVSVRPEYGEKRQATKETEANKQNTWKIERERRDASEQFLARVAAPVFLPMLDGLKDGAAVVLCRAFSNRQARGKEARQDLLRRALFAVTDWQVMKEGPAATAKFLQGLATEAGVQLPADWLDIAEQFKTKETEG